MMNLCGWYEKRPQRNKNRLCCNKKRIKRDKSRENGVINHGKLRDKSRCFVLMSRVNLQIR